MACGKYPEDQEWFLQELSKEAVYAAKLMRNKACLMWWSGDNENAVMGNDVQEDYKGRASAFRGAAPVLWQMDPYREFLPSSPYGGDVYCSNTVGTTHVTAYLGSDIFPFILDSECDDPRGFYKKLRARFVAEEPQLGAISLSSLKKFMTDEDIYGDNMDMWNWHTKSNPAVPTSVFDFCRIFAEKMLGKFTSGADRYFKCRYLQYEWIRMSMEQMRREMWFCAGMIYWMWNDCWPASSGWALLDYYNKPKDAFYAFKRCSADLVLSLDKEGDAYVVYASNLKSAKPAQITFCGVKGQDLRKLETASVTLPETGSGEVYRLKAQLAEGEALVAEVTAEGVFDRTFWVPNKPLLAETAVQYTVDEKNRTVTVTADSYVHAVELEADAVFTDNCFSLLPGETRTVGYRPNSETPITCMAYTLA